jgi:carbon-monoxide dehydrogenase large subunit
VHTAAGKVLEQARELAAELLEAAPRDLAVTEDGSGVGVAGVPDRMVSWSGLARVAEERGGRLGAELDFNQGAATFPFGTHVAVVEVDLDTGFVTPLRHVAVDDCGRVLNPLIVRGQQHGGIAQGIAQALWEHMRFDAEGNPITGTLADYTVPTAADLPPYEVASTETPTPLNELGAKGIGEAATIGATPAVQNAVIDALAHLGVRHVDMPCTPERVWRAIRSAANGGSPVPWREPPAIFATLPIRGESDELAVADI